MNDAKTGIKKTQTQRRETTRQQVLTSACKIFGEKGFEKTSLEDIAADSGLTISPIYHYFTNKLELFTKVNEVMESRLIEKLDAFSAQESKINLYEVWDEFLAVCKTPGFIQIVLLDAPHILGHDRWKESPVMAKASELLASSQGGIFSPLLSTDQHTSHLSPMDQELIMRMLMAALAEAALMVGRNPDYDSRTIIHGIIMMLQN